MAARLVVFFAEGIAGEQDHLERIFFEVVARRAAAELAARAGCARAQIALVFARIVLAPDGVVRLPLFDGLEHQRRALGFPAALHDADGQQAKHNEHTGGQGRRSPGRPTWGVVGRWGFHGCSWLDSFSCVCNGKFLIHSKPAAGNGARKACGVPERLISRPCTPW